MRSLIEKERMQNEYLMYPRVGELHNCSSGGGVGILVTRNLEYRERKDLSLNVPKET